MSRIYLPHADQFDLTNENLAKIANALAASIDLSTWAGIQKAVRVGVAPDLIPVGTQLKVTHSVYGDMLFDVVAHNHFKSAHDKNAHTMTLMSHDIIAAVQFDAREAFYYADDELPAGTYNFTLSKSESSWGAGTYMFNLQETLPKGGQLCIAGQTTDALTSCKVTAFINQNATSEAMVSDITLGNEGTSLGTFGVELNHPRRVAYGSNNYKESAIRQFLNSSSAAGSVWKPQTKVDRPPSWATSLAGFAGGFDADFLSVVGKVIVPCSANSTYESLDSTTAIGEKYTVADKFYLVSQMEVFGNNTDSTADGSAWFPYYESADAIDRIKYRDGSAVSWWTRTPNALYTNCAQCVQSAGARFHISVNLDQGCSPAFTIV